MKVAIVIALVAALATPAAAFELDGLVSPEPAGWEAQPASGMRVAHFVLKGGKDDLHRTELIVFHFGKGGGGGVADNVARWKGMFEKPEVTTSEETIAGARATIVELHGTYLYKARPMDPGPGERRPGQKMIGVVFETPGGPYFMRLVGPDTTVDRHRSDFLTWLRAFKKK